MGDDRQRVLDATDIVGVVGEHLNLKPKGREFVGICPFHDDHKPSMSVVPHKQIFCCFSCGAAGNVFDFVMRYHNMEFREALQFLADRAGVTLTPFRPGNAPADEHGHEHEPVGSSRAEIAQANEMALSFFRTIFNRDDLGKAARDVANERGISDEMIERFEIGAAPDMWDGLLKTIESRSMNLPSFIDAGLIRNKDDGKRYDTFRDRLIFPIFDQLGRPIAFGGRMLKPEDTPKYLNSPESSIYDKSSTLYGLKQSSPEIKKSRVAVVTEGYTDTIACHQAGFTNVVATCGTSLTPKHAAILKRLCETVVLLFDGDEAGQKAADRALELFFAQPIEVRIATLPGGQDPDDLLKADGGVEAMRDAIGNAQDALEYRFARLIDRLERESKPRGSAGRAEAINEEIRRYLELGLGNIDPIRQRMIVKRIARVAGVAETAVRDAVGAQSVRVNRAHRASEAEDSSAQGGDPGSIRRRRWTPTEFAFGCLLVEPKILHDFPEEARDIIDGRAYGSSLLREAVDSFVQIQQTESRPPDVHRLVSELQAADTKSALASLVTEIEHITQGDAEALVANWKDAYKRARIEWAEMASLHRSNTPATNANEIDEISSLIEARRSQHQDYGGNPLAMPRPAS